VHLSTFVVSFTAAELQAPAFVTLSGSSRIVERKLEQPGGQ
jgi:hypothetical protein